MVKSHLSRATLLEREVALPEFFPPLPVDPGIAHDGSYVSMSIKTCIEVQNKIVFVFANIYCKTVMDGKKYGKFLVQEE